MAAAAAASLVLVACSSSPDVPAPRSTSTDVSFTACSAATCTGTLDGAAFEIVMPTTWNGTLLLWSHGIRTPKPLPLYPDEPVQTDPEVAPDSTPADVGEVGQQLLDQGYALAGSAFASNGWAVDDGVAADEALYKYFVDNVGTPDRTLVWGKSLGGLVTALVAEKDGSTWVDGAAPMCGVLAGGNANLDLALDTTYGIRQLLEPSLKLTDYTSWGDAQRNWQLAYNSILAAGKDTKRGVPAIVFLAALADAQKQTKTFDGATIVSQVKAYAEALVNAATYGTFFRYDIEQRLGGDPSENTTSDYAARISDSERSLIDTIGGPGTTDRLLAKMVGQRVSADDAARTAFASSTPTGAIQDPTITVHTKADPLVIAQNETVYADLVAQTSTATNDLVQAFTVAPDSYPEDPGAPYGAGHCNFTPQTYVGTVQLLDNWVRQDIYPGPAAFEQAWGPDSGYSQIYRPGPWPAQG
jgi:hypothetical protein